jgi:hypothetical protein
VLLLLAVHRMRDLNLQSERGIALAIGLGVGVTLLAAFVAKGFDPLKPSYSVWLWPPLVILLASGCAANENVTRYRLWEGIVTITLSVVLVINIMFLWHVKWYLHGTERAVSSAVGQLPRDTVVVNAGEGWAHTYFGLAYRYHGRLQQYLLAPGGVRLIGVGGSIDTPLLPISALGEHAHLVLATTSFHTYHDLRLWKAAGPPAPRSALIPGWTALSRLVEPGLETVFVTTYGRSNQARVGRK